MSKLLSQGGFGCVFYPGINCDNNNINKNVVSKIQKKDFAANNEIIIGNILKTFISYQWYFLPVINECPINIRNIKSKDIMKCDVITKASETKKFVSMDIPYLDSNNIINILEESEPKKLILILSEAYRHLLNAIEKLIELNVIHYDLKVENILFSKANGQPRIIDFGISIPVEKLNKDNLKDYFYIFAPDYYIWCPSIHFINFLLHEATENLTNENVIFIVEQCIIYNKILDNFSPDFVDNYRIQMEDYFNTFVGKTNDEIIDELMKFKYTWDNYSLSIMYLNILSSLFPNLSGGNNFLVLFTQLLLKNITPIMERRLDIFNSRKYFDNLFFIDDNINSFINISQALKNNIISATYKINTNSITHPLSKQL